VEQVEVQKVDFGVVVLCVANGVYNFSVNTRRDKTQM